MIVAEEPFYEAKTGSLIPAIRKHTSRIPEGLELLTEQNGKPPKTP